VGKYFKLETPPAAVADDDRPSAVGRPHSRPLAPAHRRPPVLPSEPSPAPSSSLYLLPDSHPVRTPATMFAAIRSASSSRAAASLARPISSTPCVARLPSLLPAATTDPDPLRLRLCSRLASSASSRHDNNPEVLQHEKARNLKGEQDSSAPHKDTAPGWNERLASCVCLSHRRACLVLPIAIADQTLSPRPALPVTLRPALRPTRPRRRRSSSSSRRRVSPGQTCRTCLDLPLVLTGLFRLPSNSRADQGPPPRGRRRAGQSCRHQDGQPDLVGRRRRTSRLPVPLRARPSLTVSVLPHLARSAEG
jgi:hypothetical protein